MNDEDIDYSEFAFSNCYVLENYCVQLIMSDDIPPPQKTNPENLDFLIHIKHDGNQLDDDVLYILDKAIDIITKKAEKDPDGSTTSYKARIDTDSVIKGSNVYIRDENKDPMTLMGICGILTRLTNNILTEIEESDGEEDEEEEENNNKERQTILYDD